MKKTQEKKKNDRLGKDEMEYFLLPLHWFFTSDSTTIKHILSHMMESQFPNLDPLLRYASHLLPKKMLTSRI
jgi:hypothetical protein